MALESCANNPIFKGKKTVERSNPAVCVCKCNRQYSPMHAVHIINIKQKSYQESLSYKIMVGRDALGTPNSPENCCMIGSIFSAPALYSLPRLYSFQRFLNEGQL